MSRGVALALKCPTCVMPTTRPRHMITETDRLAEALEVAAVLWPEARDNRGLLLRRILDAGMGVVEREDSDRLDFRRNAVKKVAGSVNGVWPAHWREDLRDEWPA